MSPDKHMHVLSEDVRRRVAVESLMTSFSHLSKAQAQRLLEDNQHNVQRVMLLLMDREMDTGTTGTTGNPAGTAQSVNESSDRAASSSPSAPVPIPGRSAASSEEQRAQAEEVAWTKFMHTLPRLLIHVVKVGTGPYRGLEGCWFVCPCLCR